MFGDQGDVLDGWHTTEQRHDDTCISNILTGSTVLLVWTLRACNTRRAALIDECSPAGWMRELVIDSVCRSKSIEMRMFLRRISQHHP